MTGKEAFEDYKQLYVAKEFKGGDCAIQKMYEEIINDKFDELTKYKRAFEILKSKEIFEFKDYTNMIFLQPEDYIWNGDIIEEMFINVSDEEYELLEELMKDAKD